MYLDLCNSFTFSIVVICITIHINSIKDLYKKMLNCQNVIDRKLFSYIKTEIAWQIKICK